MLKTFLFIGKKEIEMGEIGGEFHWAGIPSKPFLKWSDPHIFLSTGRAAVTLIWQQHQSTQSNARLWIPAYFCPHTVNFWLINEIDCIYYLDHPKRSQPDWTTLNPVDGDIVIAVNYFGVRSAKAWQEWHEAHPHIVMVEDHTHDPFSAWACSSKADYAFASLRKTLPVSDGAIIWSPSKQQLPTEPTTQDWYGSMLKFTAMIWKYEYIKGGEVDLQLKQIFRQHQITGEQIFEELPGQQVTPWSRDLLEPGCPQNWRNQREKNVRYIIEKLPKTGAVKSLFNRWPHGHCPFNVILLTDTKERRDKLREHLIAARIYPPIHWQLIESAHSEARDIACRILTIPVDYRYTQLDLDRIATVLLEFLG